MVSPRRVLAGCAAFALLVVALPAWAAASRAVVCITGPLAASAPASQGQPSSSFTGTGSTGGSGSSEGFQGSDGSAAAEGSEGSDEPGSRGGGSASFGAGGAVGSSPAGPGGALSGLDIAAVRRLQTELARLGYFHHVVTGYYGTITTGAVRRFQRAAGLRPDGIWGPRSAAALALRIG
jgi:hypothetical protein